MGLDLIDRVPEELWTEIHDIVQEVVIKTISKKKKCKKAKWLSEEGLQIAEKRRDTKGKGQKERRARRDTKAFLSDQCKEILENHRMRKSRGLFKKIRDSKGIFHAKIVTRKDRNGKDLTEAEEIRRGGKNAQTNYTKKILMT